MLYYQIERVCDMYVYLMMQTMKSGRGHFSVILQRVILTAENWENSHSSERRFLNDFYVRCVCIGINILIEVSQLLLV